MYVKFQSVNDHRAKGIILTAESLYQLRRSVDNLKCEATKFGAKVIVDFLEQCYEQIK